ncbi:DUF3800 domain-containing protein [Antarcticimicrobium sediminis]|uniref:DUF3800 domain-containing protein n=1 Tax=Antarcticimicrobium sediminis TaxID=2546227 RepID=A0A4R5F045_9RHOB|nr:DUF3800 domain-containing protein [Antarcticimicrobium sediminis]TDE40815.1 DUF3800 domain-containing protein [Antarcticimicrobium sediminis]
MDHEIMSSYKYVLYIDEAGDDGLTKIRPIDANGASEWLILSGYLIRAEHENSCRDWLDSISDKIQCQSPIIHFRELSPMKGTRAAELLASHPARAFVVASNKKNMRGYRNERAAQAGGKQWFYNWLVRVLLERVTEFCLRDCASTPRSEDKVKILFSKRGGHSYGQTKAYLEWLRLQRDPVLKKRKIDFRFLSFQLIDYIPHYQDPGLQCSDIIASAVFRALNIENKNRSIDAATKLAPIMARDEFNEIRDFGLVLQPTNPQILTLTAEQAEIFLHYGFSKRETAQDRGRFDQKR